MDNNEAQNYFEYKKNKAEENEIEERNNFSKFSFLAQIFITTFIIMFIIIAISIMKYSSKMDIEYIKGDLSFHNAENVNNISTYDNYDDEQRKIDSRLALIQQEENMPYPAKIITNEDKNEIEEEQIEEPEKKPKKEHKKEIEQPLKKVMAPLPQVAKQPEKKPIEYEPLDTSVEVFSKVLVGRYSTQLDAQKMQALIRAKDPSLNPFVKKIGEIYTLQLGSYADFNVAKTRAQVLKARGFDVWIYQQ